MKLSAIKTTFASVCLFLLATVCSGATLDDYQKRVNSAAVIVRELEGVVANEDVDLEKEMVGELSQLVPLTEKVDLPSGAIETDNAWLATALDAFEAETVDAKRQAMLTAIAERLTAISDAVAELKAAVAAERTKDEDKQTLADILKRAEYQKAQPKEESLFQKWWKRFLEWFASLFPERPPMPTSGLNFDGMKMVLQVLLFAVVIGLIGFLVWRFVPFFSDRFGRRAKKEKQDRVVLGERIGADESAADIFSEAERLASLGDHRGAIRKGYIALLCELGDRKVVRLARHKTNRDYLRDVRTREDLFDDMTGLTGNFERSWYGLRLAQADDWADFRERCRKAISTVKGF